ncbi:hypothetical protein ACP26L_07870 [Paenibacillus sp. S-38]|uniref:hypothetical protein n=1 Tax=Paenibacillus sp. S-38 TaxID=3416710 RepID=UPI003CF0CAA1
MDERFSEKPCGCLSMTEDQMITDVSETLLHLLGYDRFGLCGSLFESILTRSSRLFFQMHYSPLMKLKNRVEGMYLILRTADGKDVPAILHSIRQESAGQWIHECVFYRPRPKLHYQVVTSEKHIDAAPTDKQSTKVLLDKSEIKQRSKDLACSASTPG